VPSLYSAVDPACVQSGAAGTARLHIAGVVPSGPAASRPKRFEAAYLAEPLPRLDRLLKWWERHGSRPLRAEAMQPRTGMVARSHRCSEGLAAIYPSMMYLLMTLDLLGYAPDHPDRVEAQKQFDALMVDDGPRFFLQPCFSPVWDTAIAMWPYSAFRDWRRPTSCAALLTRALSKEVRRRGDCPLSVRIWSRRLVFRIRQRVLSRHRRHGTGPARAETRPGY